jgi:surface polysaccharide O-acyltransferase-like enzyme
MGINVSIHRKKVIDFISDKTLIIGMLVLALALLQASIYSKHGNFHKIEIFSYQNMDIIILQKIALCFFLMSLFHRFEERQLNSLKGIASMSFAIYFIHPWILKLLFKSEFLNYFKVVPELGLTVFRASVVFILSMTIAYFTKILLKEKSRFVTGW